MVFKKKIVGFYYDTTASNMERWTGACILLKPKFEHTGLNLAYYHHIYKVLFAAVLSTCVGASSSTDVQIFLLVLK